MGKSDIVRASTDKSVPARFAGTLEPNFYCRGWNAKRLKYCKQRAGFRTTHPGVGRCFQHGGVRENDKRVTHGRYRTLGVARIQELLEEYEQDPDPLSVIGELHLARALLRDYIERSARGQGKRIPEQQLLAATLDEYEIAIADNATDAQKAQLANARGAIASLTAERALPDVAEAVKFIDVISKVIHRVEMLRTAGAVSLDQVRRFLASVDRELQLHVTDEALRDKLRHAFYAIRV